MKLPPAKLVFAQALVTLLVLITLKLFLTLNFFALVVFGVVMGSLFSFILVFVLSKIVKKGTVIEIQVIKKGLEVIKSGDYDYKFSLTSKSELSQVASSINDVVGTIKSKFSELGSQKNSIQEEKNRLLNLLDTLSEGVVLADKDRQIIYLNKSAEKISGLSLQTSNGQRFENAFIIYRNKLRLTILDIFPQKFEKNPIFSEENIKLITTTKECFITLTVSKLENEGYYVVSFLDTSEQSAEEEMKLDFVSIAAHELRTPLTSIRGYISLLEPKLKNKITQEELKFMDRVKISSQQLATLVENLLDVSKIEHNTLEIHPKSESWPDIIKFILSNLEETAAEKEIKLAFNPPEKFPLAKVDKERISEVISNLVSNSINYTPNKGQVEVLIDSNGSDILTTVKDTGVGIPEESIPHLFTKFFRVTSMLEQGSKGTGLGLYITKSIVNMHGGEIWVRSKLGEGSSFFFTVPVYKDSQHF